MYGKAREIDFFLQARGESACDWISIVGESPDND